MKEITSGDGSRLKPSDRKGNGGGKGSNPRKIQALRNAVDSGKYRVDSRKVAERIIKEALREIRGRAR